MSYSIITKPSFLSDLLNLNRDLQNRITTAIRELEISPDVPRGDTIKKLKHLEHQWRYRIGDYRMVYAVYPEQHVVQVLGVGPRGEIYNRLRYNPDEPDYGNFGKVLEKALDPNQETPADWQKYLFPKSSTQSESRTLPYNLSVTQLNKWHVPSQFHSLFQNCKTEDDLLGLNVPQEILLHVMNCIWPPDIAGITQSPNLLINQPSDLMRYAEGDLLTFLLALDEDQRKLVDFNLSGPTLVKGGPGSGKSTVALYRVGVIIRKAIAEKKTVRILFTTYTNALVKASKQLLQRILESEHAVKSDLVTLDVQTLDSISMRISSSGLDRPFVANESDLKYSLISARASFQPEGTNPSENAMIKKAIDELRDEYLLEEFEWVIEGRGLGNLEEYLKTDRVGRGYSFDARMRKAVWQLYQGSRNFIHQLRQTTWGELRLKAIEKILNGEWNERWDYVLVDEAQDLTPVALSLAVELCTSPKGIFLTADALQSLYNKGFAWKNVHSALNIIGRTRVLKRNYRTTRQIAEAAATLLDNNDAVEDEETLDQFFVHTGPAPKVFAAQNEDEMLMWLAHEIQSAARELRLLTASAAILLPTNELARSTATRINALGLRTDYMAGRDLDLQSQTAKAITIFSSKGLEFPIIAIPYVEEGYIPRSLPDERVEDLDKHLKQELRLLYVGCTRSMRRLLITYREDRVSRFLRDLDGYIWQLCDFRP
jgi:superfamily I DNA/RNA helicase/mRNA-degrading endonuclease RelE of RelBE toxin-antitoxin system